MFSDTTLDLQIRWLARKLGLDSERAKLLAGLVFETPGRRA